MPSITPMMSLIFWLLWLISLIVLTTCSTIEPPWRATLAASCASWDAVRAASALWRTVPVSCSMDAAVSCRLDAVCSVRMDRSWLPVAISVLAVLMLSVAVRTWLTVWRRDPIMSPRAASRLPGTTLGSDTARLPPATSCIAATAWAGSPPIWRITLRKVSQPMPPMASSASTPITRLAAVALSTSWA